MSDHPLKELAFETHEQRIHSSILVPYSTYDCKMPELYPYVPIHWHQEYEIDIITAGEGEFICGEEHYTAHTGDIVLSLPNMLHAAYLTDSNFLEYNAFVFHQNLLGAALNDRSYNDCIRPLSQGNVMPLLFYSSDHPDFKEISDLSKLLISSAKENTSRSDIKVRSCLLELFWYFSRPENIRKSNDAKTDSSNLIKPALDYIANHYDESITIEQLAFLCSVSSSHFMGSFKKVIGLSAIEYLNHLRIRSACSMLQESDSDISQIAQNCGFSNISNFNRQFKRTVGCSPRDYRRRINKE